MLGCMPNENDTTRRGSQTHQEAHRIQATPDDGDQKNALSGGDAEHLTPFRRLVIELGAVEGDLPRLDLSGPRHVLPSAYDVTGFAAAAFGAAGAGIASFIAARGGEPPPKVHVDRLHAALAFRSERYLQGLDGPLPRVWDDLSGDYRTRGGFVRLHTIYDHHRKRALAALDVRPTRQAIEAALARETAEDVERAVVQAGGCAAAMGTPEAWAQHPHGKHLAGQPLCERRVAAGGLGPRQLEPLDRKRPLQGLRVLDLTRVIAGPICTRYLAAHGAQVLRVDPPGFAEVPTLLREVTAGKRRVALDLSNATGRSHFERLVAGADVIVHGYRPGALDRLGYGEATLRHLQPRLVIGQLSAYGDTGADGWAGRRGFDSLVQMSCGIAARGMSASKADRPKPLPAQALDHGTGYLLAAAVSIALARQWGGEPPATLSVSLARTAAHLMSLGEVNGLDLPEPTAGQVDPYRIPVQSDFGRLSQLRLPAPVAGTRVHLDPAPGPLGSHPPQWSSEALHSAGWAANGDHDRS